MIQSNWDGLKKLQKKAKEIEGTNEIQMDELFSDSFMRKHTQYTSIDEFFNESDFEIESEEDLEVIPEENLDAYVNQTTSFSSWKEMAEYATVEWTQKKLGL